MIKKFKSLVPVFLLVAALFAVSIPTAISAAEDLCVNNPNPANCCNGDRFLLCYWDTLEDPCEEQTPKDCW